MTGLPQIEPEALALRGVDRDIAWGDPSAPPTETEVELSKAISAKRQADALESIASTLSDRLRFDFYEGALCVYAQTTEVRR